MATARRAVKVARELDYDLLTADLIRDEGLRLKPYRCSEGYLTIGIGYNVDARGLEALEATVGRPVQLVAGITRDEAMRQCAADIDQAVRDARRLVTVATYEQLDPVRRRALVNFCFNLGLARARGFRKMIAAVQAGNYPEAARQMMASLWASQVGDGPGKRYDRAERLSDMMAHGVEPTR